MFPQFYKLSKQVRLRHTLMCNGPILMAVVLAVLRVAAAVQAGCALRA